MKFCSFSYQGVAGFGLVLPDDKIIDLGQAGKLILDSNTPLLDASDLKSWLSHGKVAIESSNEVLKALERGSTMDTAVIDRKDDVRLLAPIPNPGKIIAIGLNYRDHAEEQDIPLPQNPMIFAKFTSSLAGPDDAIQLPDISKKVDPEAELCVVMLESGKSFSREEAREAIAGYTIGNDVSARDLQFSDRQWVRGKSCDTFAPCGPFLVTEEELGDPHQLDIKLYLNGNIQQSSNTSNLIFDCYTLVSFISQTITLETGDLIFTGTPGGVGVFQDPPVFLKSGDVVDVVIEKIGTLRNTVG
ncbi:MAG: fumarylacetoacetate hydrolase family protein [Acidobacteriota bacterium]|nr:fumarylacetoacetate hydrolase family protein [Acidobacteriota bacterium]